MSDAQTQTQTSPAETIGAIYAAFGRGDLPALFALLHPEVDWSVTVTAPGGDLHVQDDTYRRCWTGVDRRQCFGSSHEPEERS